MFESNDKLATANLVKNGSVAALRSSEVFPAARLPRGEC